METLALVAVLFVLTGWLLLAGAVAVAVVLTRRLTARVRDVAGVARIHVATYRFGPAAEVARLRLELRKAIAGTQAAVTTAVAAGWPVGDAPSLVRRLQSAAAEVDGRLQLVSIETVSKGRVSGDMVADVRARVETITASCADLRASIRDAAGEFAGDDLDRLSADCRIEAAALRHRLG